MTLAQDLKRLSRTCSARYATRRRPERDTFGPELIEIAKALGQPFMPWQHEAAMVGGEINPKTGLPAYREIMITVPRQSGKTTLYVAWQSHRGLSPRWTHPQRSVFTAQTGKDARDKWLDEIFPLIRNSRLSPLVDRINEGMGNESLRWKNGSMIRLLSTSSSSGHSKTLQQAVLDEIWHDTDGRREQGLRPAMITIPDAQLLVCSTAGTETSVVLDQKVKAGRAATFADSGQGMAYFEYSAPDDWDPDDEESYYTFMPALCPDPPCQCGAGEWRHTVTIDAIRTERQSMQLSEFKRAYGNIATSAFDEREIPLDVFLRVCDPKAEPTGELRFGIDCLPDRSFGAIVASGTGVVELLDYREGARWMIERGQDLHARWGGVAVVDGSGPAAYIGDELEALGVPVERLSSTEVAEACARMHDDIADDNITFAMRGNLWPVMDRAVGGVAKRPVGDRFIWSRAGSHVDITPFMAATIAWRPGEGESHSPFAVF